MGKLRTLVRDYIARLVLRNLTVNNVKAVLESLIGYLECKANETETLIDNWIVEGLRAIVADDEKMKRIYDFIQLYILPSDDGVCKSLPSDCQWQELAADIAETKTDENDGTCKAIGIEQWLIILQLVLPPIMDAYERFFKDKE